MSVSVRGPQVAELTEEIRGVLHTLDAVLPSVLDEMAKDAAKRTRKKIPKVKGQARKAVRASRGQIKIGGSTAEYLPWLDFGGTLKPKGGRRNTIERPVLQGGRYLYPAIAEANVARLEAAEKAMQEAFEREGLEVTPGG